MAQQQITSTQENDYPITVSAVYPDKLSRFHLLQDFHGYSTVDCPLFHWDRRQGSHIHCLVGDIIHW